MLSGEKWWSKYCLGEQSERSQSPEYILTWQSTRGILRNTSLGEIQSQRPEWSSLCISKDLSVEAPNGHINCPGNSNHSSDIMHIFVIHDPPYPISIASLSTLPTDHDPVVLEDNLITETTHCGGLTADCAPAWIQTWDSQTPVSGKRDAAVFHFTY